MLSLEDCLEFSDLATAEIEAIARHEHVPLIVAAEMGCQMLKSDDGVQCIESMIRESAEEANEHGHPEDAARFMAAYQEFHAQHPAPLR